MSGSTQPSPPIQPLSIGNVVSAGLRIYRDHFQQYYGLAFKAYLWVLVPVYGWAKFPALSAAISRLVFGELTGKPETVSVAQSRVNRRLWSFLIAGILVFLILFGVLFAALVVYAIISGILGTIVGGVFNSITSTPIRIILSIVLALVFLVASFAFIYGYMWLFARLSVVELPLAIEDNMNATSAISRSWNLTEGFARRICGVVFITFLISLPISILIQVVSNIQLFLPEIIPSDAPIFSFLFLVLMLAFNALLIPLWQSIKAVIYYDLRTRREGMGLQIRDFDSQA